MQLQEKGGRKAVVSNPNLDSLYNKIHSIEDEILAHFKLPKLMKFRAIVFAFFDEDPKAVLEELEVAAKAYFMSSPMPDIRLLEYAKETNLRTYDVLPEIGIKDSLVAIFYFEEYFKKGKIEASELIQILSSFNQDTLQKMGRLNYYTANNENPSKTEKLFNELKKKQIPFLEEYITFYPSLPY